jgi:hypothetical protein
VWVELIGKTFNSLIYCILFNVSVTSILEFDTIAVADQKGSQKI